MNKQRIFLLAHNKNKFFNIKMYFDINNILPIVLHKIFYNRQIFHSDSNIIGNFPKAVRRNKL